MLNMCQISSLMAAAEGPVAEQQQQQHTLFTHLEIKKYKRNDFN